MSKESLEHLSSLMDGELSHETGMFLTRRLSSDDAMCDTWERYHLIRDCIRQPGSKHFVTGFGDKVAGSLESEVTSVVSVWRNRRWLKPVSGMAIAASVALMAIVVTAPQVIAPGGNDISKSSSVNQPFVSPNVVSLRPVSQSASYNPTKQADTDRLNAYLLRHNQMARTAGRQGFVTFVPIVATYPSTEARSSEGRFKPASSSSESEAATHQ